MSGIVANECVNSTRPFDELRANGGDATVLVGINLRCDEIAPYEDYEPTLTLTLSRLRERESETASPALRERG